MSDGDAAAGPGGCTAARGMLPLRALGDAEGDRLPPGLPPVIDAHVHLFPDPLFRAIWRWFEEHGWPIRYQLGARAVLDFLFSRGVRHVVALHYAHKPGIARSLNAFVASLCAGERRVTGMATVFPGEPEAVAILEEAFALGLKGVKLHCHVQALAPDDPRLWPIYELLERRDLPLVIHAGREPRSPAYPRDTHEICSVERVDRVLGDFPGLRICVPHLGADEFEGYARLLERRDNLWLDTTMMLAEYFPGLDPRWLVRARPDRILYGSDFPNLPYAWDREIARAAALGLDGTALARVMAGTAVELYGIDRSLIDD